MERIFPVMTAHGPRWDSSAPADGQARWRAHADFMNALKAANFVLIGGTFEGTPDMLLIVRAASDDEARRMQQELRSVVSVRPLTLRLGEDFAERWVPARPRQSQGKPRSRPEKAKESQARARPKANESQGRSRKKAKESQGKPTKAKGFRARAQRRAPERAPP